MAFRKSSKLCCIRGRYRRTIGKFVNAKGRLDARKFLLGTERQHAERANLRLEQLWRDIEKLWRDEPAGRACTTEPIWEPLTLHFAEAIRKGQRITLPDEEIEREAQMGRDVAVANWYWWIRSVYPSIADLIDEPEHPAFIQSQTAAADNATVLARIARHYAEVANRPAAASPPGQSLHTALNAWQAYVRNAKTRHDGQLIEGGRKIIEAAERLKECHADVPLEKLDFGFVDAMANYWCSRPPSKAKGKNCGNPISVVTVKNMLGYLRRFLDWLHRSRDLQWRDTDRIIEDALGNRRTAILQTPEEKKKAAAGPAAWTIDELVKLYELASDRERLYMLLGLNGGFAQSEIMHLLTDEINLDRNPPDVRYIRHKSGKSAAFVLWPETVDALNWLASKRAEIMKSSQEPWAIVGDRGNQLDRQAITNAWYRLLKRVRRQHRDFRQLSFKMLRKTNARLVSQCGGDSEVVAIIHGRAKRSTHDDQADAYYPRMIERVRPALAAVRKKLKPMFDAADEPFAARRKYPRPTRRLTPDKVRQLRRLRRRGMAVDEVAAAAGCSASSVSRYTKAVA